jgi:integrase
MRVMMGLLKDRHGTYYARHKVPLRLQAATARTLENGKAKQVWLKRSLGTKKLQEAHVRAKPVQMEFDRIIARAEETLKARPMRTSLSDTEIKRMAEYTYAHALAAHDEYIREAPEEEADQRKLIEAIEGPQQWAEPIPEFGLSGGQLFDARDNQARIISETETALARGDIGHAAHKTEDALETFQITLDPKCAHYRKLGMEVLRAHVRGIRAIAARDRGEPIETPPLILPQANGAATGGTLRDALEGWRKERSPSPGVLMEYERAVRLFNELHGDIAVAQITRTHARTFREALQELPSHRRAKLLNAKLPELAEWGRKHPDGPKITNKTLNKLFGGVQTIARWAFNKGMVPDDVQWSDPFAGMRLPEDAPEREAFTVTELNVLFTSSVFTRGERPKPGKGEAAFWMPLLGLFTGARRGELAALTAKDVHKVDGVFCFTFVEERASGKKLKTRSSARTVPVHPQLIKLGWLTYVDAVRRDGGEKAWLFPQVAPGALNALKAWTKWFNRHLRSLGVADSNKVFHSFRHIFKDALRTARIPEDLNDALTGHSNATVGRGYGAKQIVQRYGIDTLKDAVDRVSFKGLNLPNVRA